MNVPIEFNDLLAVLEPRAVIFPDGTVPVLTASEMIDQSALFRDIFGGRWPHMG